MRKSKVLIYVHDGPLAYWHVPIIYNTLRKLGKVDNLDIFLSSLGGDPDAAYKIVRLCREFCRERLATIVPFMAKSAATLLAIGTDEIVMGPPSELGAIDPQIVNQETGMGGPTQAIRDCIDFLEERFRKTDNFEVTSHTLYPILGKLDPFMIGTYERAVKMSRQYAELLLRNGMLRNADKQRLDDTVRRLNETYYSHGYAIDRNEARDELGLNVIDASEDLWDAIWALFLSYHVEMIDSGKKVFIETLQSMQPPSSQDEPNDTGPINPTDPTHPNENKTDPQSVVLHT